MKLPEIDFSSLEFREIGSWPLILRIASIIGACIVLIIAIYFLIFDSEIESLKKSIADLEKKRSEFKEQYTMAVNLDAYKDQMKEMQSAYQEYVKQLPSSSNIPELIDSLTKIGESNGLKINSIKLGDSKLIDNFYMSLPLTLSINGGYHNIGIFISETAKLARIVTLNDFNIKVASGQSGDLQMDMQAETYWLANTAEIDAQKPATTDKSSTKKGSAAKTPAVPVPTQGNSPQPPSRPSRR